MCIQLMLIFPYISISFHCIYIKRLLGCIVYTIHCMLYTLYCTVYNCTLYAHITDVVMTSFISICYVTFANSPY